MEQVYAWFFPPGPREVLSKASRDIERSARRLDRQRLECDAREKAVLADLRRKAAAGLPVAQVKALARDVARVRASRTKVLAAQEALESLRSRLVGTQVAAEVSAIMASATAALASVPAVADPARLRADVLAFEKTQTKMEMLEDAVDGALADDDAADEGDEIADQILAEAGVVVAVALPSPGRSLAGRWPAEDGSGAASCLLAEDKFRT